MDDVIHQMDAFLQSGDFAHVRTWLDRKELENPELFESLAWPHSVHFAAHLCANELEDARFLYKRMPDSVKGNNDLEAMFKVLQQIWIHNFKGAWQALSHSWDEPIASMMRNLAENLRHSLTQLIENAYIDIRLEYLSELLGLNNEEAKIVVQTYGWDIDESSGIIHVKKRTNIRSINVDNNDLQTMARYVLFLEQGELAETGTNLKI